MSAAETTPYTAAAAIAASPLGKLYTNPADGVPAHLREIIGGADAEIARLRALLAERDAQLEMRDSHIRALETERTALASALAAKPKAARKPRAAAGGGGGGSAPAPTAAKKVAGRMQNQILKKHLLPGEKIHRKVGGTTYTATWDAAKGLIVCEALATGGKAASPVEGPWDSPSGFARACSYHALGMPGKAGHAVNGWDACWIERDAKKIALKALRVTDTGIELADDDDAESVGSAASAPMTGGASAAAFAPARAPTPPMEEDDEEEEDDDEDE